MLPPKSVIVSGSRVNDGSITLKENPIHLTAQSAQVKTRTTCHHEILSIATDMVASDFDSSPSRFTIAKKAAAASPCKVFSVISIYLAAGIGCIASKESLGPHLAPARCMEEVWQTLLSGFTHRSFRRQRPNHGSGSRSGPLMNCGCSCRMSVARGVADRYECRLQYSRL
ncbi:hypothetical protein L226DRAFT_6627 [Lentinus tigrinus ALCF2SS1-7]|uniref:uncharacterized protein n=1 Tax=Lentinus tigrinus ALCF2SS1-7 TaxID=1328758 RepID=UPI0011661049|nr:hypothetical protein L226DRAFT_6627 [Lentinus tigrinus ALCF2SS1-7]